MSASSSPQPNDQPKSSDQKQLVVASGTSVEAANRSVVLCETEVQPEQLELDTQPDQKKKKSDVCADEGEKKAKGAMDKKKKSPVIFALTPQNRWDSDLCDNITLFEPDRLIAETNGLDINKRSFVVAELPIPKKDSGIFYYEVNILKLEPNVHVMIGLITTQRREVCGGYLSNGILCDFTAVPNDWTAAEPFGVGDVVGCGVDLATRQLIYTKNGVRLDTADLIVPSVADLFPIVWFLNFNGKIEATDGKIEANFGPNFKYKGPGQ